MATKKKLKPTAGDIEGPFYREGAPFKDDLADGLEGTPLFVSGSVTDTDGNPIEGAIMDVWQADNAGEYDNDTPNFSCRGKVKTGSNGKYSYETIMPGRYLDGPRYRPSHIHYKVFVDDAEELTTQMYFEGDPFNKTDRFFKESLAVKAKKSTDRGLDAVFDIVLEKA